MDISSDIDDERRLSRSYNSPRDERPTHGNTYRNSPENERGGRGDVYRPRYPSNSSDYNRELPNRDRDNRNPRERNYNEDRDYYNPRSYPRSPPEPIDNRPTNDRYNRDLYDRQHNGRGDKLPDNYNNRIRPEEQPDSQEVEQWKNLSDKIRDWNEEKKEIFHLTFPDKVLFFIFFILYLII